MGTTEENEVAQMTDFSYPLFLNSLILVIPLIYSILFFMYIGCLGSASLYKGDARIGIQSLVFLQFHL